MPIWTQQNPGGAQSLNPYVPAQQFRQGQYQPRRSATSMVQPSTPAQQQPLQIPANLSSQSWAGSAAAQQAAAQQKPINGTPVKYDWGGYTNPYGSYTQPGAYVPPPAAPPQAPGGNSNGSYSPPSSNSNEPFRYPNAVDFNGRNVYVDNLGHGDFGEYYDSLGHPAFTDAVTAKKNRHEAMRRYAESMFNDLSKDGGMSWWTGGSREWDNAGKPMSPDAVSGNYVQYVNRGATPTTPSPTQGIYPGETPTQITPGTGTPYQYPFANQPLEWYGQPANQQAVNGYWNAYSPMMEFAQNQNNNLNNWNMDVWKIGWGMVGDQFNMGMDQAELMNDYNNNLNTLASNDWSNQLQADVNAYGYGSQLYGNMYNSDAMLAGNYLNAGANLANTYANTGLGYDTLTNQYSIAQMQALNDWYNQQARNQADMQIATMQAFGRDQAPNTRFLSNWG